MKKHLRRLLAIVALAATWMLPATHVQAAFEDIEVSPRERALGCAWAAAPADVYAAFHNPAALAWLEGYGGAASWVRPFGYDFSSQSALTGVAELPGPWGGVGVGLRRFGVDYMGESLTSETTLSLAHGFRLMNDWHSGLSVGWSASLYALDFGRSVTGLDPGSATSVGFSVGAQAVVRQRTYVGFHALNINNPTIGDLDREDLRRRVVVGVSYLPYPGVRTNLDLANELGERAQFRGGAEFEVTEFAWLRAGLRTEPNQFTGGIGLRASGFVLDYGYSTGGVLADTHQFGMTFTFDGGE